MARKKGGKAAASTLTSTSTTPAADADAEAPPMSRTSTTDSQKEERALSRIEAVSDGNGQFVDSALDASRSVGRGGGSGSDGKGNKGKGGKDGGGDGEEGSSTLPGGEGSRSSGLDFGSLKHRIAGAIDHAVHPKDGSETSISKRQYWWITAGALWLSSLTSGALSMVLLLNSLKERHSVLQVAIIFAGYQFAGTAGALVGGNVMTIFGLRSTLMAALALQATATAAFIPMRHGHKSFGTTYDVHPTHVPTMSIGAATAYATVVQLFNGLARVLVRLGTKTLPRLVTPDLKRTASKRTAGRSERGLMWKSAMVNGGRTFVRGGGFFIGGALLTIGFTNSLVVLTMLTMPGFFIVFFVLPDVVGRAAPSHKVSWSPRELFCFSRGVTVTTTLLLLQNAAQFAWLQLTTLLRNKTYGAFKMSHLGVSAIMSGVQMYEGLQSSVLGIPLLRWLKQTPPHTNKWTMVLWSAAAAVGCIPLIVLSLATNLFYAPTPRSAASGSFFASLLCFVFPMQVSNLIGSFVFQHFVDRTRVATSSGFSTSLQAAGRGLGVLASGVIYALAGANDGDRSDPVPGFGGSVALACAVLLGAALIAAFCYSREYGEGGLNCGPCFSLQEEKKKSGEEGGGGGGGLPSAAAAAAAVASDKSPPPRPGSALKGSKASAAAAASAGAADAEVAAGDADVEKAVVSK